MSIDAEQEIDQVNRMVDNLLELADEALEEGSTIDAEQVKDMTTQIKELLSGIFEQNYGSWGGDSEDDSDYMGDDDL